MHRKAFIAAVFFVVAFLFLAVSPGHTSSARHVFYREQEARSVAHYIMAVRYDLLGATDSAAQEYAHAARYDHEAFSPQLRLGMSLARLGQYSLALKALAKAAKIRPDDLQAHYFSALVHSSLRNFAKAAEEYETILKKLSEGNPENIELFIYLGQLYYFEGEPAKAAAQFERVLEAQPNNTDMLYLVSSYKLEDFKERPKAIKLLQHCIDIDPLHAGCLNSLSYVYAEDNVQLDEALELVQRALEIEPNRAAYLDTLGWIYYRKRMYERALKELHIADSLMSDPVILDHLADVYLQTGKRDVAQEYWRRSLELDPDQVNVRSKLEVFEEEKPSR